MAIFSEMQVMIGKRGDREESLIPTTIHYGHQDRIVASIIADNTQNTPLRLPAMSAMITAIGLAPDLYKGVGGERRNTYVPVGGLLPDDIKVVHQRMPVPYRLGMELVLYASNTDQHLQMLEQILMIFDPELTVQKSDGPFDWARLTSVVLKDISMDTNYPSGVDSRIIQSTLTFDMPIYIDTPADVRANVVRKIFLRVGAVSTATDNNYEAVAELDRQGINYKLLFTEDDLTVL